MGTSHCGMKTCRGQGLESASCLFQPVWQPVTCSRLFLLFLHPTLLSRRGTSAKSLPAKFDTFSGL